MIEDIDLKPHINIKTHLNGKIPDQKIADFYEKT